MAKVLVVGNGRMGSIVCDIVCDAPDLELAGVIGKDSTGLLSDGSVEADVVVDFSHRAMLAGVEAFIAQTRAALVSGTTGYDDGDMARLQALSHKAAVIHSANYSIGVAALRHLASHAARLLEGFDIEIVETHHNKKADAPSGTAKMLLAAVDPEARADVVYGREGMTGARKPTEIGIHAVRGGTVAGTHTVHFFGQEEEVSLTHRASSRRIFAEGAVEAARRIAGRPAGMYTFDDLLFADKEGIR